MRTSPIINVYLLPLGLEHIPPINMSQFVTGLKYEDSVKAADKLVLTINNETLSNFDEPLWRAGNTLRVSWGYAEAMTIERVVKIKRVTGFRELKIEAVGGELALDLVERVRGFENMSYSEIARQIATEWGYLEEGRTLHIDESGSKVPMTIQGGITDANLLRKLQAKTGFSWFINHDGFHFHAPNYLQRTDKRLRWRGNQTVAAIIDISLDVDVTTIPGSVDVRSHSPRQHHGLKVAARRATDERKQILAKHTEAAEITDLGVPGWNMPADAPIPPHGLLPLPGLPTHHPAARHEIRRTNETVIEQVKANAEAALAKMMRGQVKMKVTIVGDPNVYAATVIEIDGIGKRLSQRYYVTFVEHRIGSGGYETEIECVSDGTEGHSTKSQFLPEAAVVQMAPKNVGRRRGTDKAGPGIKTQPDMRERDPRVLPPGPPDLIRPRVIPPSNLPMQGNIDLEHRPHVRMPSGQIATVRSVTREIDGLYYLLPTIADDGRVLSDDGAVEYFFQTQKHLGIFATQGEADQAGTAIHKDQEAHPPANTLPTIVDGVEPSNSPPAVSGLQESPPLSSL